MTNQKQIESIDFLLLTPPFTQINTPYPATPFLKKYLTHSGYSVRQKDFGIDLILKLFSKRGLQDIFRRMDQSHADSRLPQSNKILNSADRYISTIDSVIRFLQYRDPTLALRICRGGFLPSGTRIDAHPEYEEEFGESGVLDKAKYICTQTLNDLSDLIRNELSPHFGFSTYAEKIALSATSFDVIEKEFRRKKDIIDEYLEHLVEKKMREVAPSVVGVTVPFPGCLLGALKITRKIKTLKPDTKTVLGGGYVNTELRELQDTRVFQYVDYIALDSGETILEDLIRLNRGGISPGELKNVFFKTEEGVSIIRSESNGDCGSDDPGVPDYSDLNLQDYLSVVDILNPMHRLWNDGRWNKLLLARGCYWHKCAFCDTSLPYIKAYEPASAEKIVNCVKNIVKETGQTGFHFVDEAAPPKTLKHSALELLKRDLHITWWTNIRFEKVYSPDLCRLLAASGCIAVAGGLETVSDRLLKLMNKGISIRQSIHTLYNLVRSGIMVHAYLMYGFPTQTELETIDSLNLVRQYFDQGLIRSAFWHQFSATAHSEIGKNPGRFEISITGPEKHGFAWNDLTHADPKGCSHDRFSDGLRKALYNYIHGIGLDYPLDSWFDFEIPESSIADSFVSDILLEIRDTDRSGKRRMLWLGTPPIVVDKGGRKKQQQKLIFNTEHGETSITLEKEVAGWILEKLDQMNPHGSKITFREDLESESESLFKYPFAELKDGRLWSVLKVSGLIAI